MKTLQPTTRLSASVRVPGSRSYTLRLLIASALAVGPCAVVDPLLSEDTLLTLKALSAFGLTVTEKPDRFENQGGGGRLKPCADIYLANSGTSMRLLTAAAALAPGISVLSGTPRMHARPIGELLDALNQLAVPARSLKGDGCPPIEVHGGRIRGGKVRLRCGVSSQYLSGLLLVAPFAESDLDIDVIEGPVSRPYIDMTLKVMEGMGVRVTREGYNRFKVPAGQSYRPGTYAVEPDASNASYFWAAAAVVPGTVRVLGLSRTSAQGDLKFLDCLEAMGCRVAADADGITVTGGDLRGIDVDMSDMPDMVPTRAVVAAFATGRTLIRNVAHLRAKESDRLSAVAAELARMGVDVSAGPDSLTIAGGRPRGAEIHTYGDHRMAMSFAVAGLRVPDMRIADPGCVEKSFPTFWDVWQQLY